MTDCILFYDGRRNKWRFLRGRETFYNEKRQMIEFDEDEQAREWFRTSDMTQGYIISKTVRTTR